MEEMTGQMGCSVVNSRDVTKKYMGSEEIETNGRGGGASKGLFIQAH